ncbi:MAG TPA: rhomboid family intramembrane serine protease [Anaerolineae bacterium]|nr:rhomboid family intramembrane serine protease [Anaerolineae bacterium]
MIPIRDHNRTQGTPVVTIALIALNVIAFFFEFGYLNNELWPAFADKWTIIPAQIVANPVSEFFTVFTAMFLHGGIAHLGGNMLYLWIFGDNIEYRLGHVRFLIFYLVCGIVATLAQIYIDPTSQVPNIGASGAIAGVLGGYFLLFPMTQVTTLIPVIFRSIRLPAILVLGFWFLLQFWSGWSSLGVGGEGGGVAFWAHIGGFVAGVLLVKIFGNTSKLNAAQIDYFQN